MPEGIAVEGMTLRTRQSASFGAAFGPVNALVSMVIGAANIVVLKEPARMSVAQRMRTFVAIRFIEGNGSEKYDSLLVKQIWEDLRSG